MDESQTSFRLGDRVTHKIVKAFGGVVVSITKSLHRAHLYGVQPEALKEGRPANLAYFEVDELQRIDL